MIKTNLKFFAALLLFLVGNVAAQDIGSCDGSVLDDSNKLPITSDKVIQSTALKNSSKQKSTKGKSNYLSSFKLLIPHGTSDH